MFLFLLIYMRVVKCVCFFFAMVIGRERTAGRSSFRRAASRASCRSQPFGDCKCPFRKLPSILTFAHKVPEGVTDPCVYHVFIFVP